MAKKNNLKSVRLSDQVMDYVINFEGDGFNQKFVNLVLFCMEQEETKKQKIAFLDRQIVKQYKKMDALRQLISKISAVSEALLDLEWRTNDLSALMDELLEDKDEDQELPFPLSLYSKSVKGERSSFILTLDGLDTASTENQTGRMGSLQGEHPS